MNLPISNDELLRCVFYHSVLGIAVTDPQGHFLRANPALCSMLGYTESELRGTAFETVTHADDHATLQACHRQALEGDLADLHREARYLHKDGTARWASINLSLVPAGDTQDSLVVWQFVDLHDRRQTEQALRDANTRLTEAQRIAHIGYWDYDPETDRVHGSEELYRIFGMDPEAGGTLSYDEFISRVHPEDRETVRRSVADLEAAGTASQEYRILLPDGTTRLVRGHRTVERNADGRVRRLLGTLQDITERVATEQALQARIQRDSLFLRTMQEGYWLAETDGRFTEVNDTYCRMVGYTAEELLTMSIPDVEASEDSQEVARHMENIIRTGFDRFETRHRCKDGELLDIEIAATFAEFGGRKQFFVFARDISERKRAERKQEALLQELQTAQQQLVQSEKMAALGQLAAGVAHEINNPLGYISSNLTTLGDYLGDLVELLAVHDRIEADLADHPALQARLRTARKKMDLDFVIQDISDLVAETQEGTQRVNRIVQDLKSFSHGAGTEEWEYADLHQGIETTLNIVHNELKYKTEVVKAFGKVPAIECIPSQLNQVFMNLLVNAAQAIEGRGRITLRTACDGEEVVVEVSDTGNGIPEAIRDRIFDPFFTTKPVGKGTGLGLSISHKIVEKHGGRITIDSEPGQGTTFRIFLPIQRQPAGAEDSSGERLQEGI